ncbi:MAG TPA: 4Fe-4S dicluster domain-containing protein [Ignavibacteriaceae bacterium]|nr:4Fe-4S dicluster domain-containing protein [Ignavibacteriaceae bacterium]
MDLYKILFEDLQKLISDLLKQGSSVVTQSAEGKKFIEIKKADEFILNPASKPTDISMKEYFFPKSESLFFYKKTKDGIELIDASKKNHRTVIIGAKPCDAAALPILSKVFNWDYKDEFFNQRANNTIIIGIACSYKDSSCFCTSAGLSPDSEKGSDLFLIPLNDNEYLLKLITEKGKKFLGEFSFLSKIKAAEKPVQDYGADKTEFDYLKIKNWLDNNFSSEFWDKTGELCLGCAQCAYVCPVCHCFDIVDESCGLSCGRRVKNWDSCQFGLFTKHASGHNPRNDQGKRYRQRINHKFKYYNERFGEILCTGCGRCSRGCPVSINILEILQEINRQEIHK